MSMNLLPEILQQVALLCDPLTSRALRSTCKTLRAHISEKDLVSAEANWRLSNRSVSNLAKWAVRKWHRDVLFGLFDAHRDFDELTPADMHPILLAATRHDDVELVKLMLKIGADVNHLEGDVLGTAADTGNVTVVKLLREGGAKVNGNCVLSGPAYYREGAVAPLWIAVDRGHVAVAEMLLKYGADVNYRDPWGGTLIGTAEDVKMIQTLLDGGAIVGDKVLQIAVHWANEEMVDALLNCTVLKFESLRRRGILGSAVHRSNLRIMKALLNAGADVLEQGLCTCAVKKGDLPIVNALLEAGMPVPQNDDVLTPAITSNNLELMTVLLDAGANVAFGNGIAVVEAARRGQLDFLRVLLSRAPAEGGPDGGRFTEFMNGVHSGVLVA
ncbi:hypothetical protein HDV00_011948 [Rhizophlyctis rosea]|nr:hypothetical protein HDV00_011948 [Rhizophlyctis rosea]